MDEKQELDIAYFVAFCTEQYKHLHQMSGSDAMNLLDSYGVTTYLASNYEALHTQGHRWIMQEIEEFIDEQRKLNKEAL
jgi:hypothetical protein